MGPDLPEPIGFVCLSEAKSERLNQGMVVLCVYTNPRNPGGDLEAPDVYTNPTSPMEDWVVVPDPPPEVLIDRDRVVGPVPPLGELIDRDHQKLHHTRSPATPHHVLAFVHNVAPPGRSILETITSRRIRQVAAP